MVAERRKGIRDKWGADVVWWAMRVWSGPTSAGGAMTESARWSSDSRSAGEKGESGAHPTVWEYGVWGADGETFARAEDVAFLKGLGVLWRTDPGLKCLREN